MRHDSIELQTMTFITRNKPGKGSNETIFFAFEYSN
jgi:hypothetical protein